ncbi:MAG: hypothetical protein JW910_01165 [Anaerolineae bacterium]|nr:hypothetical protein [Anaerolineae bacterium]
MRTYLQIFIMGISTGMRTLAGPSLLSSYLSRRYEALPARRLLRLFAGRWSVALLRLGALGELVGDKLPMTPSRLEPEGLAGRLSSGALVGLMLAGARGKSRLLGMALGMAGAGLGAVGGYQTRHDIVEDSGLPDSLIALVEDAVAYGGGWLILRLGGGPALPGSALPDVAVEED